MKISLVQIFVISLVSTILSFSSAERPNFVRRRKKMSPLEVPTIFYEEIFPGVIGALSFYGTLGLSTCFQKSIGVTTANRLLSRLVGFPTVCAASILSERSIRLTKEVSQNPRSVTDKGVIRVLSTSASEGQMHYDFGSVRIPQKDLHACIIGLAGFKLLGGRFWAIAPSSYAAPGSFARVPIQGNEKYIQGKSKDQLNKVFKRYGCHVCGSKVGPAIGDHNPPKSIGQLIRYPTYQFYPHCGSCSSRQGGIMGAAANEIMDKGWANWRKIRYLYAAGGGSNAYNHAFQPRVNHLAGGICATSLGDTKIPKIVRGVKSDWKSRRD